jgi:hypothetical protein
VEQSSAKELLGSQWVERHKDFVEGYGEQYHNVVWMPLVRMLQVRAPAPGGSVWGKRLGEACGSLQHPAPIAALAPALAPAPMHTRPTRPRLQQRCLASGRGLSQHGLSPACAQPGARARPLSR